MEKKTEKFDEMVCFANTRVIEEPWPATGVSSYTCVLSKEGDKEAEKLVVEHIELGLINPETDEVVDGWSGF